jgi:hypothetical protein
MSRTRVLVLATLGLLAGGALVVYVLTSVPPTTDGQALDPIALLLGFAGLFLLAASTGVLVAILLHGRWPALAGRTPTRRGRTKTPPTRPAVRQGILFGLAVATLVALAMVDVLDVAFFIVTFLVAGLIEAYAQTRK